MNRFIRIMVAWMMLAVSFAMLTTASFAWFTMNRRVTADGIDLKVTAPGDLKISVDNDSPNFDDSATAESLTVAIGPVSSADALTFFYAKPSDIVGAGQGQGHVKPNTLRPYVLYHEKSFQKDFGYQNNVFGFQDFKFILRNSTSSSQKIKSTFIFEHQTEENKNTVPIDCKAAMRIAIIIDGKVIAMGAGTDSPCKAVYGEGFNARMPFESFQNAFFMAEGVDTHITIRTWLEGGEECIVTENFTDPDKAGTFKFSVAFTV